MNTIWLHRISCEGAAAHPLLDRGYLTIGFSDFSTREFISHLTTKPDKDSWGYFEGRFEEEWGVHPRSRYSLWKFVVEMKAGDMVLVPKQGVFSIYEITEDFPLCIRDVDTTELRAWGLDDGDRLTIIDDLLSRNGEASDLGFARRVRPLHTDIPRASFADAALTSRMKIRSTTADISDLKDSVGRAIGHYKDDEPIDLHATLLKTHIQTTLDAITRDLTPHKFEQLIAWYFERVGARVEQPSKNESGKEGDGDIVATFDGLRTIIYVQAKKHDGMTDEWAAEQIVAYRDHKATPKTESGVMDDGYARIAWVVSTADGFTDECKALAKDNKVLLLNGRDFVKLLLNAGIEGLEKIF